MLQSAIPDASRVRIAQRVLSALLGAVTAVAVYLLAREAIHTDSPVFGYLWILPLATTLLATLLYRRLLTSDNTRIAETNDGIQRFMRSLPVAVLVTDMQGRKQYANEKAQELLANHQLVQRDTDMPYPLTRAGRGNAEAVNDDERIPLDVYGVINNGAVVTTLIDVSHRLDTERALHLAQARDRAIYVATNDVIWEWNVDDGEMTLSDRVSEIVGSAETKMRREEWLQRVHAEDRQRVQHSIASALGSGKTEWKEDYRLRRRDGTYAYVMDRAAIVRGDGLRIIGALRDVSDTQQLQARLAQADRMSSLGTLAAGVAHEINNPLAFVLANMEYVLDMLNPEKDAPLVEALEEARVGVERINSIVKDLKSFSRSDGDEIGPVDLLDTIESAVMLASNEIRHRARLVKTLGHMPHVTGTQAKLGQVFLNLIVNAAQAIPDGRKEEHEIRIHSYVHGAHVTVEVQDTGSGMPEHVKKRIFEPFFTTKPQGVGTGLGLSICHGIIKSFGGDISCESEPGKGTTFRITLRIAAPHHRTVSTPAITTGPRRRVLVIDDEPLVLNAVSRMFKREHDIVTFDEARDALKWLESGNSADVLLCDVMMPHMSGQEFYAAVPEHLRHRMVFITGGAFSAEARLFFDAVPNETVAKPFDRAELLSIIERISARPAGPFTSA